MFLSCHEACVVCGVASRSHVAEQPSPETLFPSSQASPVSRMPSPQNAVELLTVQPAAPDAMMIKLPSTKFFIISPRVDGNRSVSWSLESATSAHDRRNKRHTRWKVTQGPAMGTSIEPRSVMRFLSSIDRLLKSVTMPSDWLDRSAATVNA